ncbi:MAG: hypothetical protein HY023_07770 [Chloroflexi bacterium]|nr:hypothetical protein [Chloroflexota bacterium]MBI3760856.1 hypothetical protein [Chloroflexota bacterium]
MSRINIGGPMPDGTRAQDLWVDSADFICASGTMLSEGPFKNILGKLCLTTTSLVMLPYEGDVLEVVQKFAAHLRKTILGPYAEMADTLERLGLYAKGPEVLDKILVWPLADLDEDARAEERRLGPIRGGADLIIKVSGETYYFNLRTQGHEQGGFASAQTFRDHINRLRPQ